MHDETRTIIATAAVITTGAAVAYYTTGLSTTALITGAAVFGIGTGLVVAARRGYLSHVFDQLDEQQTQGKMGTKGFDELWDDLQEWESREERDTEIVWHPQVGGFTTTVLRSSDEEWFRFVSIVALDSGVKSKPLHICVEAKTGFIVHHKPMRYKEEWKYPFRYIPITRDLRRMQITGKEVVNRLRNASIGRLRGGYTAAFDETTRPPQQETVESGEQQ
jgi:hypothetical protein